MQKTKIAITLEGVHTGNSIKNKINKKARKVNL